MLPVLKEPFKTLMTKMKKTKSVLTETSKIGSIKWWWAILNSAATTVRRSNESLDEALVMMCFIYIPNGW